VHDCLQTNRAKSSPYLERAMQAWCMGGLGQAFGEMLSWNNLQKMDK
jgi:hypothetical protein